MAIKDRDFIEVLGNLISSSEITWALAEAENELAKYIVFGFKPRCEDKSFMEGVNVIVRYDPVNELILWIEIEFLISTSVSAKDFFGRISGYVMRLGGKVVVKEDGISFIFRVKPEDFIEKLKELIEEVSKLFSESVKSLEYIGYEVLQQNG